MNRLWWRAIYLLLIGISSPLTGQTGSYNRSDTCQSKLSFWAYDRLNLPDLRDRIPGRTIIIAVVDDAFRLSHNDLRDYIYHNPGEKKDNFNDDDGNGKKDDFRGWDISDTDNDVNPPPGWEDAYYHGTFVSGAIITVLKGCYGPDASKYFKILPVKVLSDNSDFPFMKDGYAGVEYAIEQNVDIICCAWGGGEITRDQENIIEKARERGIAIIGSAGNYFTEKVDAPSKLNGVLSIGGLDTLLKKTKESNYGTRIDLVAPAVKIRAAYPLADNAYFFGGGTSGATALVSGCVAILKAVNTSATPTEIYDALINTSLPVDNMNLNYCGKLGAGLPVVSDAIDYLESDESRINYFNQLRPEGKISINSRLENGSWVISPGGAYNGFKFKISPGEKVSKAQSLAFYAFDTLWIEGNIESLPREIFVPGSTAKVEYLKTKRRVRNPIVIEYSSQTIDSSSLYCRGLKYYTIDLMEITDGSSTYNYANNSDCKWQINAPEGKRIEFEFSDFDTQPIIDFLYLFDGEETIPGNTIARFSGRGIPPVVVSRTNKVLAWFVTDSTITGKGWKLKYRFVD